MGLLIIAVAFSLLSIVMNVSLSDIEPVQSMETQNMEIPDTNDRGNINIAVTHNPNNGGAE